MSKLYTRTCKFGYCSPWKLALFNRWSQNTLLHLWTNHWEQSASSTLSVSDICEVCKFALNGCSYEHAATDNNVWGLSIWRHHANSNNANVLGLQFKDSSNIIAILEYTPSLDWTNIVSLDVNALLWGPITQYGWHSDWACRTVINLMLSLVELDN